MIRVWFLAMKKISSIGGCVSALLVLVLSANDGHCLSRIFGSRNNSASNGITLNKSSQKDLSNFMQSVQNGGKALQKSLQAQQRQQQILAERQRIANENAKLRKSMLQRAQTANANSSANLKQQEKMLELQRKQILAQNEQRMKMLRNQLNQEQARQNAQMKNIEKQVSAMRSKINVAQTKEKIQNKANQIFSGIKNGLSGLKNKIFHKKAQGS